MPVPSWRRLENAATALPAVAVSRDTYVYRICCELFEPIDPHALQRALDRCLVYYRMYRVVLKKGAFWYYLEESDLPALVTEENTPPCRPLYDPRQSKLLFQVSYYRQRINVELFHILSDGVSTLRFLSILVLYYLAERYDPSFAALAQEMEAEIPADELTSDPYQQYYESTPTANEPNQRAYQLTGARFSDDQLGIIEAVLPVGSVLQTAKQHQLKLTEYLTALLIKAIDDSRSPHESDLSSAIAVPVNLRSFFPSRSGRNFYRTISVRLPQPARNASLHEAYEGVRSSFRRQLHPDNIKAKMNRFTAVQRHPVIRLAPLGIKRPVLRFSNYFVNQAVTAVISNVGVASLPEQAAAYVRLFSCFSHTRSLQLCFCSYRENLVLSFTSPYRQTEIQRRFFAFLTEAGIPIQLTSNIEDLERMEHL